MLVVFRFAVVPSIFKYASIATFISVVN